MKQIVVVDKNWGIGKNNGLLFRLKKDMQYFRKMTTGKVVVMGANTFRSLTNGALPNRVNIVLDCDNRQYPDAVTVPSVARLDEELAKYNTDDVFVIGGASVYKLLLERCDEFYVTKVFADGDAQLFYENLDNRDDFQQVSCSQPETDGDYTIAFCKYVRI